MSTHTHTHTQAQTPTQSGCITKCVQCLRAFLRLCVWVHAMKTEMTKNQRWITIGAHNGAFVTAHTFICTHVCVCILYTDIHNYCRFVLVFVYVPRWKLPFPVCRVLIRSFVVSHTLFLLMCVCIWVGVYRVTSHLVVLRVLSQLRNSKKSKIVFFSRKIKKFT